MVVRLRTAKKRKNEQKDNLPATLPWERREEKQSHHRYAAIVVVGLLCLSLGFIGGFQLSHDPITITTTTTGHGSSGETTTSPTPPPNNTNPSSPPPPAPITTLLYGVVNPAGVNVNLSLPGWTLMFNASGNGSNRLYNASLTLQWNAWKTNYWFAYSIVLVSDVSYTVTVHQNMNTWITVEGSITPIGANMSQNFITTGPAY